MNEVKNLFKKLFSKDEEDKGFHEEEIDNVEQKLGIKLPEPLREFYLTQVRNILINSCHDFARPEQLFIKNSKWLLFYGENQGIWACAFNLEELQNKELKVYINFEQMGYEEEAKNFKDFLIVRAACDYGTYIYPYKMFADDVDKKDLEIVIQNLGIPKSDINPKHYFRRKLFWENENEIIRTLEFDEKVYKGKKSIFVQSFNRNCIEKYQALNKNIKWKIYPEGEIKSKKYLTSFFEKREEAQEKEIIQNDILKNNSNDLESKNFDLPF